MIDVKPEALVVLGGGIQTDGAPSERTDARVRTAVKARFELGDVALVLSGNHSFLQPPGPTTEARSMRQLARQLGVPDDAIALEEESLDTIGNALFTTIGYVHPNNWSNIVVVTSETHLARALGTFSRVCGAAVGLSGLATHENKTKEAKIYEYLAELVSRVVFRNTSPGDIEAIKRQLFDTVPGYEDATMQGLLAKCVVEHLRYSLQ